MKHIFIQHTGAHRLLLFFAGWGMDGAPFAAYRPAGRDFMVCYDYSDASFDASLIAGYDEVDVVGWSMGVWMAARSLSLAGIAVKSAIAINGTMFPVDAERGIAPEIFHGTLDGISDATLMKFRRRMCGGAAGYKSFMETAPQRSLESLRTELDVIGKLYESCTAASTAATTASTVSSETSSTTSEGASKTASTVAAASEETSTTSAETSESASAATSEETTTAAETSTTTVAASSEETTASAATAASSAEGGDSPFHWDEAVIGDSDAIFPTAAQQRAWSERDVKQTLVSAPHYKEEIFRHYLEEIWTND
jgi:biotin synthesis protein BioG